MPSLKRFTGWNYKAHVPDETLSKNRDIKTSAYKAAILTENLSHVCSTRTARLPQGRADMIW
jgi:hypothetical protein